MTRKRPTATHKTLTVAEVGAKLADIRQQMDDLLIVAEQTGGEQLRDLTDCIMGFDDLIASASLQLELFERRVCKLREHLGETA